MILTIKIKITVLRISNNRSSLITKKMNRTITGLLLKKLLKEKMKEQTLWVAVPINNNYNLFQLCYTLPLAAILKSVNKVSIKLPDQLKNLLNSLSTQKKDKIKNPIMRSKI
jgi:hypothetical protein